jgi:oligopeptide/dipeptide ABC transporter ATP-binding protein
MALLEVDDLTTQFAGEEGTVTAVNGISFGVEQGEVLGIVGESGSGKSVTAQSIMNIVESTGAITSGRILFKGENLLEKSDAELQDIRGDQVSIVFQDPMSALNPVYTVGFQISRVIRRHRGYQDTTLGDRLVNRFVGRDIEDAAKQRAAELMRRVRIPNAETRYHDYPHEFSGGMAQRALIAMAISCNPDLLIADEPTTGLDVTTQRELFTLLTDLCRTFEMGLILITHDLGVAAKICDRLAVMYAGNVVEVGPVDEVFEAPHHPYTEGLLQSVPRIENEADRLDPIPGSVPDMAELPGGCNFHPRCPHAVEECRSAEPPLEETVPGRQSACYRTEVLREQTREEL